MARVGPKTKVALIVLALLALVVLVNRLYAERLEIWECRDKQGLSVPCSFPPDVEKDPPGVGVRTICEDKDGKYVPCPPSG